MVDSYLAKEQGLGRVVGPVAERACKGLQINRFGVVPRTTNRKVEVNCGLVTPARLQCE